MMMEKANTQLAASSPSFPSSSNILSSFVMPENDENEATDLPNA